MTTSSSGYALTIGHDGFSSVTDVRRGETLRYQDFIPDSRPDTYQGVITYTQGSQPVNEVAGAGLAGSGAVVVGRFSVKVP